MRRLCRENEKTEETDGSSRETGTFLTRISCYAYCAVAYSFRIVLSVTCNSHWRFQLHSLPPQNRTFLGGSLSFTPLGSSVETSPTKEHLQWNPSLWPKWIWVLTRPVHALTHLIACGCLLWSCPGELPKKHGHFESMASKAHMI